jgi:hypothetical protein
MLLFLAIKYCLFVPNQGFRLTEHLSDTERSEMRAYMAMIENIFVNSEVRFRKHLCAQSMFDNKVCACISHHLMNVNVFFFYSFTTIHSNEAFTTIHSNEAVATY